MSILLCISFHTFFSLPLFFSWLIFAVFVFSLLFSPPPSRYIGVLTTWDKLTVLTPWIQLTAAILLFASFVLFSPFCFAFFLSYSYVFFPSPPLLWLPPPVLPLTLWLRLDVVSNIKQVICVCCQPLWENNGSKSYKWLWFTIRRHICYAVSLSLSPGTARFLCIRFNAKMWTIHPHVFSKPWSQIGPYYSF